MAKSKADSVTRRWLRGMLDRLRESTVGGDDELRALMMKLEDGALRWVGRPPTGVVVKNGRR